MRVFIFYRKPGNWPDRVGIGPCELDRFLGQFGASHNNRLVKRLL